MVTKESLHLGQRVWFGASDEDKKEAVVDGITQTCVGLVMAGGGYVIADWSDVHGEA